MQFKLSEVLTLNAALEGLDGHQDTIKTQDGEQVIRRPYLYASSKTTWNIAKNRRVLKEHVQTYTEARDALIKEISGGIEIPADDKTKVADFTARHEELLAQKVEVTGLLKLKLSDLFNERKQGEQTVMNPIPASVLNALFELIEE